MIKLKDLKKVKTYEDLESLGIGRVYCNISHRGGGIGFYGEDVANYFEVPSEYLPVKFGAGCNYLGGGLRGSIFPSDFFKGLWENYKKEAKLLVALAEACIRVYKNVENEAEIPDDVMIGIVRVKGVTSAY